MVRGLELFCGIGGFAAAAAAGGVEVVAAIDQDAAALDVYRLNFPGHHARQADLEKITPLQLAFYRAQFWWLSPPCQPYCLRGNRLDLDDPRGASLKRLMGALGEMRDGDLPTYIALENVEGFRDSAARELVLQVLRSRGYHLAELL
ncbi:MAG TPA: DNA cytosine methyltransferase, partial [Verrucomicrobiae bacterium]|nr:DNA cytosine methyltransferase [Verrucomicrobiae bacterium]